MERLEMPGVPRGMLPARFVLRNERKIRLLITRKRFRVDNADIDHRGS